MKFRIDSDLAQLSHDQLDQLYDWIGDEGYREAIRLASLPEPEGFGLKLHKTTLVRFYHRERARRQTESLLETRASEGDTDTADPTELLDRAKRELAHATYELSIGPLNGPHYNALSRAFYRMELLTLEHKRLELDTRKFEYNAIAAAVKHANELQALSADETMDDIQKFELARKELFGRAVDGIPIRRSGDKPATASVPPGATAPLTPDNLKNCALPPETNAPPFPPLPLGGATQHEGNE